MPPWDTRTFVSVRMLLVTPVNQGVSGVMMLLLKRHWKPSGGFIVIALARNTATRFVGFASGSVGTRIEKFVGCSVMLAGMPTVRTALELSAEPNALNR